MQEFTQYLLCMHMGNKPHNVVNSQASELNMAPDLMGWHPKFKYFIHN